MEVALLLLGVGAFAASFIIPEKVGKGKNDELQIDAEVLKQFVEKEMQQAKQRVSEVVDETLEYAVEKTERASERISNEKIMAISDYSETVLADMNKTHQEVMFLYDMLNDKHKNLKETVKIVDKQAKEAEEKANAAATALAAKEEATAILEQHIQKASEKVVPTVAKVSQPEKKVEQRITLDMLAPEIVQVGRTGVVNATVSENRMSGKVATNTVTRTASQTDANNSTIMGKRVTLNDVSVVNGMAMKGTSPVQMTNKTAVAEEMLQQKNVEVYSFAAQAPRVDRPAQKERQAQELEKTVTLMQAQELQKKAQEMQKKTEPVLEENNNDKILRLYKAGNSSVDIAKELGLGVGEVKLVINLFKGAV